MNHLISPTIEIKTLITGLDWIVFFLVLLITILSVIYGHYLKKKDEKQNNEHSVLDLLLMGRRLTLPMFVATLVATWYGGIFGVTRIAFEKGVFNFVTQGFFWYLTYIFFAFFVVDKVKSYDAITLPNLIEQMFGKKSAKISAIFNFFNVLPIVYVISLGIFLKSLFGGELITMMCVGITVVIAYSFLGGFRAVVFSDIIQFFVMCLTVFLVLFFSVKTFGGISFLKANLPTTHFKLTGDQSIATTFVWGFIALSTLVDPNFYQRCFAAKNSKVAKKGILISTFIWVLFDICTTLGAMYARAVIPDAAPDSAYLIYAIQLIPEGLRGLILAGILATILSTLDSYIFLAGTTLTFDLLPKRFRGKIYIHHLGIIFVGILAIIMAQLFQGNIKTVWKTLGSYSSACLLLPVMIGYIAPGKISDKQFLCSSIFGIFGTTYWRIAIHSGFWAQVDELYVGCLCTLVGIIFYHPITKHMTRYKKQSKF